MDTDEKPVIVEEAETVWTEERCLEFLDKYRAEPCLWDCRLPSFKMRVTKGDAWRRVAGALSWLPTLHEMKKKRNSLMSYYRIHIHKFKVALEAGREYHTNWFAFRTMHGFLAPIYAEDSPAGSEVALSPHPGNMEDNKRRRKIILNKAKAYETTTQRKRRLAKAKRKREEKKEIARAQQLQKRRVLNWMYGQPRGQVCTPDGDGSRSSSSLPVITTSRTLKRSLSDHYEEPPGSPSDHDEEPPGYPQFIPLPGPCKSERSDSQFDRFSGQTCYDEFDQFGLMLASKVRRIDDFKERETVMNVIQNIVFQSVMKSRPAELPPKSEGDACAPETRDRLS